MGLLYKMHICQRIVNAHFATANFGDYDLYKYMLLEDRDLSFSSFYLAGPTLCLEQTMQTWVNKGDERGGKEIGGRKMYLTT